MALQMIWGVSGSGKSTYVFDELIHKAEINKDEYFLVLVPDQFSQEAQRILVEKSGGAILNIDVLSFHRLAYRAFEEIRQKDRAILGDEGKIMLLRKVIADNRAELSYFTKGLDRAGFLDECKSLICELVEYGVGDEELDRLIGSVGEGSALGLKIKDIKLLYNKMTEKMGQTYRLEQELIPVLTSLVSSLSFLKGATICLDGFTGFTPVQYELLGELMRAGKDMYVTVTTDRAMVGDKSKRSDVFSLSNNTIERLIKTASMYGEEVKDPIVTGFGKEKDSYRLTKNPVLNYVEKNIFCDSSDIEKIKLDDASSVIHIRACRRIEEEAEFTAIETARLIRNGNKGGRIAVLSADPDAYEPYLRTAFERMNIRYFSDRKKSLGTNPLTQYISAFLYADIYGFDTEHMIRLLRCRISPLSAEETDVLENYIIASGRRGFSVYEDEWTYDVDSVAMPLDKINEYRNKIYESFSAAVNALKGGNKAVKEFTEIIYNLLKNNSIYKALTDISADYEEKGEILLAKEYKKLYAKVLNIFDDMVRLLGDERVSLKEYTQILLAGISQGVMGFAPPSEDAVLIGDVERSRLSETDYIFLLGNNDDIFPKGSSAKGIITEGERIQIEGTGIELAPSADKLYLREQFYLYMLITKPKKALYLTYAKATEKGEGRRPSYLIDKLRDIFSDGDIVITDDEKDDSIEAAIGTDMGRRYFLRGIYSDKDDRVWKELAAYYSKKDRGLYDRVSGMISIDKRKASIQPDTAKRLYGEDMYASVTRFEQFMECPYSHYLSYGLRLREREKFVPDPRDRGNIFHSALENLTDIIMEENKTWQQLSDKEISEYSRRSLDEALSGYRADVFLQDKRTSYITKKINKVYCDAVKYLVRQMQAGEFVQAASESSFPEDGAGDKLSFVLPDNHKLFLHGRIDRIDTYEDADTRLIKIIDYKSSEKKLSLGEVYHGLQLQLFTYMLAALSMKRDKKNIPAALIYFAVDERENDWVRGLDNESDIDKLAGEGFMPQGYVNSDADIYTKLDRGLLATEVKSYAIPVVTTKSGAPHGSRSKTLSTEQFDMLMEHTVDNIIKDGEAIYGGQICARPAKHMGKSGCDFCGYAGVCGIELKSSEQMSKNYPTMKDKQVWEALGEKNV